MLRSLGRVLVAVGLWVSGSYLFYHSASFSFTDEEAGRQIFPSFYLHGLVSNALIFYGVLYFFPRNERRWSPAFLRQMALLYGGVTALELIVDRGLLVYLGAGTDPRLAVEIRLESVLGNLVVLAFGIACGLILDWFHQHRLAREVRQQQVETELELLKSRIQPHFLFNTLNGIFYLAHKNGDEETATAIGRLAQMMRYMLDEVSEAQVLLAGELTYMDNYVAMQRMRLAPSIPIRFTVAGEPGSLKLPPMLLLPFVENAFKHGVSNANPTPIEIEVRVAPERVCLVVENHCHPRTEAGPGGFGLRNVVRRLDLLFPGRYRLEAGSLAGRYRVSLSLELGPGGVGSRHGRALGLEEGFR